MKKKILISVIALLLIVSVIGGVFWYKKKQETGGSGSSSQPNGPLGPGQGKLTDALGNVMEITSVLVNPLWGFNVLVNGVQNGHLVSMEKRADGLVYGTNAEKKLYVWRNNNWDYLGLA